MLPESLAIFAYLADLGEDGAFDRTQLERDIKQEARRVMAADREDPGCDLPRLRHDRVEDCGPRTRGLRPGA
jgi:hypothetical protein